MLGVSPYIAFQGNCREAIDFYKSALEAEVLFTQTFGESPMSEMGPPEKIAHSTMKAGDSTVMMCDDPRPEPGGRDSNISLAIGLNDPKRAEQMFARLAKDGSALMPLAKTYWGEAFGIKWMVNCDARK
jgi:PhnB protein